MKGKLVGGWGDGMEIEVPRVPPEYIPLGILVYKLMDVKGEDDHLLAIYEAPHEP